MKKTYTDKQGQYLAFIYYYTKIHGCAPSEAEMQQYFRVSPPAVHQMVLTLESRGLIERTPGQARSIHLLISREEIGRASCRERAQNARGAAAAEIRDEAV